MNKLILLALFFFTCSVAFSQTAYETQRRKVNNLLENRSQKFGQYDESLKKRTGIFGLKTKKDMQRSIDILTQIVQTDNAVFSELKVLLEYKDFEKSQVQTQATETETRMNAYMQTVKKLQDKNEALREEIKTLESRTNKTYNTVISIALSVSALLILLFATKKLTFK